jgi:aryl-alcohol dehydrogenase-like predicted oxidoreductase
METIPFGEFTIPRMTLGTVQFGLPYGIANEAGRPAIARVREILEAAFESGVTALDTAAAYGESEAVLGQCLRELGAAEDVFVVTKVRPLTPDERADPTSARAAIRECVEMSLRRLGMDRVPAVLFHREDDAVFLDELAALKDKGLLAHAGVSCGQMPASVLPLLEVPDATAFQIPCNLLDFRHRREGVLRKAAARGACVFVRSVYLQGLLLMPEEKIPHFLRDVIEPRRRLEAVARAHGLGMAEAAMRFVLSLDGVASIVTGVDTPGQLRHNIALFEKGPLPPDTVRALEEALPALDDFLTTPPMWERFKE